MRPMLCPRGGALLSPLEEDEADPEDDELFLSPQVPRLIDCGGAVKNQR